MTYEDILEMSASELEKLTDQQLEEVFKPYFNVTRPELVTKKAPKKTATGKVLDPEVLSKLQALGLADLLD